MLFFLRGVQTRNALQGYLFCNSTELPLIQVKLHNRLRHSIVTWLTTVHLITQIKERLYAAGDEGGWGARCSEAELINRADEHQL